METISAGQLKALKFFHRLPLELIQTLLNAGRIQEHTEKKPAVFQRRKYSKCADSPVRGSICLQHDQARAAEDPVFSGERTSSEP